MADGINIRILPKTKSIDPVDYLLVDNRNLGTQVVQFSSVVLSGSQVSFYSDFLSLSSRLDELSASTTTYISGGASPSGKMIPQRLGIMYFAADTKDYYISVGTINNNDWRRIYTVDY